MSEGSTRKPEILCIGFGALGTIYSYLLSQGGANITAVARSNFTTLTTTGIHISSAKYGEIPNWKPHRCVKESEPESARDRYYDYVVCTFKNVPDFKSASSVIKPFLRGATGEGKELPTIVLLQNGVGIEEEVQRNLVEGEHKLAKGVISTVAWIGANLADNGTKVVHGALERLEMGIYPSSSSPVDKDTGRRLGAAEERASLDTFAQLYLSGGGGGKIVDDIEAIRWQKVLWNAAWGGLSTLARCPVSALLTEDTLHHSVGVVRRIMLEILYVARSCGLNESRFPASSIDRAFEITLSTSAVEGVKDDTKGGNLAADFKPSILLDLENGRPMELEVIVGNVVKKAREGRVETPRLDLILAALKPNQVAAVKRAEERERERERESKAEAKGEDEGEKEGVVKYGDLKATSRGNWAAGAPVSKDANTYL